ncbi:hypothetical protein RhiirC2_801165 [Rhizophagus irregularis]|uniref:Uncharacterized protein n=1 Tax=Rhizophagus irregularis TaxID=588596 RepID=A0A2N1M2R9_9GLOM|nr:hypothetical protein RhiirC2_801165 [Rhizophagus irregularis]
MSTVYGICLKIYLNDLNTSLKTADFKSFNKDFWKTHNSLCVEVFEQRFQELLEKFPDSNNYMLLAETRGFWQNGIRETAETSFAKSSRNAETAKPINGISAILSI